MYKSKLQEYCQSKKWKLPEYSTSKQGLDHCPVFKASVIVNGSTFSTPHFCHSSKEAHNFVARMAFVHLTEDSSSASNDVQVSPTLTNAKQPEKNEPLQAVFSSGVDSPITNDKKFKDMAHLYKNRLQVYAQKRNLNLPVYTSEREGPPHACRFKSKVMLEGKMYESLEYFSTIKDAENAAAKVAVMSISSDDGAEEEDPAFFKNLLQELAQKEYSCLPEYATTRSGPSHNPVFFSTVNINGESFNGQEAKTKKLAEMNAAKVGYIALRESKWKQSSVAVSSGYHVNAALSSPMTQLIPATELAGQCISAPNHISNSVSIEPVCSNKGAYHQKNSEAEQNLVKTEFQTNFNQNNSGVMVDPPVQPPSRSGLGLNNEPSVRFDALPSYKKIKVFPVTPNMTLPTGTTIMRRDDKWVAVTTEDDDDANK